MEITDLRRINRGMSGTEAANVIYGNDRKLFEEIDSCKKNLENNQLIVAKANTNDGIHNVTLAQGMGNSTSAIMSQSAITHELKAIDETLHDVCFVDFTNPEQFSFTSEILTNAKIATRAAADIRGRSISEAIDTFNDYKKQADTIIADLTQRIVELENELNK